MYDIGEPPSTDRRTGRFAITRVAFQRGYPDNPSAAPDKYLVVLYRESGTLGCAILGDRDETRAIYDLVVSKKVKTVRCVIGTDTLSRVRLDTQDAVRLSY